MLHSSDFSPGVSRFTLRGHHLDGLYRDASYRCSGGLWTRHRRQAREQLPHDLDSVALVVCKFGRQTLKGITGPLTSVALNAAAGCWGSGVEEQTCVYRLRAVGLHPDGIWGGHVTRTGVISKRTCSRGLRDAARHFHDLLSAGVLLMHCLRGETGGRENDNRPIRRRMFPRLEKTARTRPWCSEPASSRTFETAGITAG